MTDSSPTHDPRPAPGAAGEGWFRFILDVSWPIARRWKMIASITAVAFVGSCLATLAIRNSYKAQAHYLLSSSSSSKSALGGLVNGDVSALMGMKLGSSPDITTINNLLGTRSLAESTIQRFHLERDWKLDSTKRVYWEDNLKLWSRKFSGDVSEDDGVTLAFESRDSVLSAQVVAYIGSWVDSSLRAFHRKQAKDNADFFLGRILAEDSLLDSAQGRLVDFQKKHKLVRPDEQIVQALQMAGTLESSLQKLDLEIGVESATDGQGSPVRKLEEIRRRTSDILRSTTENGGGQGARDKGFVFRNIPSTLDLGIQFEHLYRDVQIHRKALLLMIEGREQMMVEYRKTVPLLVQIDAPKVPSKKSAPARSSIVVVVTFFAFCGGCLLSGLLHKLEVHGVSRRRILDWVRTGTW